MKIFIKISGFISCLLATTYLLGQSPIQSATITNVSGTSKTYNQTGWTGTTGCSPNTFNSSTTYNIQFGQGNNRRVDAIVVGGQTYNFANTAGEVKIRRNTSTGRIDYNPFFEKISLSGTTLTVAGDYAATSEEALNSRYINRGIDAIFQCTNIRRWDYIYNSAFSVASNTDLSQTGFPIFERAGNDDFRIAAITGLDNNGDPNCFGNLLYVGTSIWGNGLYNLHSVNFEGLEGTQTAYPEAVYTNDVKGVFISFQDLGISAGQQIYGYAIFDSNISSSNSNSCHTDLVDWNTLPNWGASSLDVVASGLLVATSTTITQNCLGIDSDNDGIANVCDLDDDNDGILDLVEDTCGIGFFDDFGTGTNEVSTPYISNDYTFDNVQTDDGEYTIATTGRPGAASNSNWSTEPDHTPGDTDGRMLLINASFTPGEFYRRSYSGFNANIPIIFSFWTRNILIPSNPRPLKPNITYRIEDTNGNILFTANTGDLQEVDGWQNFTGTFISPETSLFFVLINNSTGGSGNDLAIDDISFKQDGFCDYDNDGIVNSLDTDSDNDGCIDAIEGSSSFTFANVSNDDRLIGAVDANGVPTIADLGQGRGSSQNTAINACSEICNNGIDDDGDGLIDCADSDCILPAPTAIIMD